MIIAGQDNLQNNSQQLSYDGAQQRPPQYTTTQNDKPSEMDV